MNRETSGLRARCEVVSMNKSIVQANSGLFEAVDVISQIGSRA